MTLRNTSLTDSSAGVLPGSLAEALQTSRESYAADNPESRRLFKEAGCSMPGGNTRTTLYYPPFPLTLTRGQGNRLWDADGHEYLDFLGDYGAGLYGHSSPVIQEAIKAQLETGILLGGPGVLEARFASALSKRFPAMKMVRFCNSGTEANLFVLCMSRAFTGRSRIIVAEESYHGGVLTYGGSHALNVPFPVTCVPYNEPDAATEVIRSHGSDLAAVIVEPLLGAGGCIPATAEFLASMQDAAREVGALFIMDEVFTSRLGPHGLHGALGLEPDLVTVGKYLGGGMTFGAFGGRRDIMEHFDPSREQSWAHPGTFNNNVLTMAAGLAGLTNVFTEEQAAELNRRGDEARMRMIQAARRFEVPLEFCGTGCVMGFHIARRSIHSPQDIIDTPATRALKEIIHKDFLARGVYCAKRGMINILLPTSSEDIDFLVGSFQDILGRREMLIRKVMGA